MTKLITKPEPFDVVISHAACPDGTAAEWVARQHSPDALYLPGAYALPWCFDDSTGKSCLLRRIGDAREAFEVRSGTELLLVDFCLSRETLEELLTAGVFVTVLDHHKTAQEALEGLVHENLVVMFDMERSGAGIAWDVLIGGPRPRVIDLIEDRDLWRFKRRGTREFYAWLATNGLNLENIEHCADSAHLSRAIRIGAELEKMHGACVADFVKLATNITVSCDRGECVVSTRCAQHLPVRFCSDVAGRLAEQSEAKIGLSYYQQGDQLMFSARSRDGAPITAEELAKRFGGGGHKHAAGFRTSTRLMTRALTGDLFLWVNP